MLSIAGVVLVSIYSFIMSMINSPFSKWEFDNPIIKGLLFGFVWFVYGDIKSIYLKIQEDKKFNR